MIKLAIVATHPVQYQAPWFRKLDKERDLSLKVFYLWDTFSEEYFDQEFEQNLKWDRNLIEGYSSIYSKNVAKDPGTHHFFGLNNPELIRQLLEFEPDCVLCLAYNYFSIFKLLITARLKDTPLLFRGDSHLLGSQSLLKSSIKNIVLPIIFNKFAAILYVGNANKKYFLNYGVAPESLFFCPHAIDLNTSAVPDKNQENEPIKFLFVGKLVPKKCPDLLLSSFLELNCDQAQLHFIGSGPLETKLKKQANGNNSVFFHGFKNQTQLAELYSQYDIIILPSAGNYETWGMVIQEAASSYLPAIVSTQVGCAQDLVVENESGFIFQAGSIESLSKALQKAYAKKDSLISMGINMHKKAQQYSYENATLGLKMALEYCLKA